MNFKTPPINEVILGVQFSCQKPWNAVHLGKFAKEVEKEYPNIQEVNPLLPLGVPIGVQLNLPRLNRIWFIENDDNKLLQLQDNRFLHNWRKQLNGVYPRYENMKKDFGKNWKKLENYIEKEKLELRSVDWSELTYINMISIEDFGKTINDVHKIFTCFSNKKTNFLNLDTINLSQVFTSHNINGSIRANIKTAIERNSNKKALMFELTAQGKNKAKTFDLDWFDKARKEIHALFLDLTTKEAQEKWEKDND